MALYTDLADLGHALALLLGVGPGLLLLCAVATLRALDKGRR